MFEKLFERSEQFLGVIDDTRPESERLKDYKFEEIVATADPVDWIEKKPNSWRKFNIRNQDGSGSCVAQSMAKVLGVLQYLRDGVFIDFSASYIYKRRANKNTGGMGGVNVFDIVKEFGCTLDALMPSQELNETQINSVPEENYDSVVASAFAIKNFVQFIPKESFDDIASTIQKTGKAVMVWFRFDRNEWTDLPTVLSDSPKLHHSVTAVDCTLYKGKQYLVIEDSWGKFGIFLGQRLISREFFEKRNTFAGYPLTFKNVQESLPTPVKFTFKNQMEFGQTSTDVSKLQDVLKVEGFFPTNANSTGYYGAITAKAVYNFQTKYRVATQVELDSLQGRVVGSKTLVKLNELYS